MLHGEISRWGQWEWGQALLHIRSISPGPGVFFWRRKLESWPNDGVIEDGCSQHLHIFRDAGSFPAYISNHSRLPTTPWQMIGSLGSLLVPRDPNGKVWLQTIVHHASICPMEGWESWLQDDRIRKVDGKKLRYISSHLSFQIVVWCAESAKTSYNFQSTNGKCAESARNGLKELPKPKFFNTGPLVQTSLNLFEQVQEFTLPFEPQTERQVQT